MKKTTYPTYPRLTQAVWDECFPERVRAERADEARVFAPLGAGADARRVLRLEEI